jgi:anti-sigma regulatory factor (Ser/Thr protein kinase)/DNA-binding NarL/FixJ family response regulator
MTETATRDPGSPARGRVLIVRPESEFQAALQAALPDVDIDAVPGKMSALVQLRARDYDAVITDPVTSVREDLTFAGEIRGIRPRARVLVLAPVAPQADLIAALRAQVFACFAAPFNVDEIAHMVRTALEEDAWREGIEVLSGLPNWITLRVSSRLVTAERLIHFMTEYRTDVPDEERDTLMFAFREVLMNAIEHGAGLNPERAVEVSAARTHRAIVYYIRDPGPGFDPDTLANVAVVSNQTDPIAHLERRAALGLRPGGFGILLTRKLVDELVYNEVGNHVILVKYTDHE